MKLPSLILSFLKYHLIFLHIFYSAFGQSKMGMTYLGIYWLLPNLQLRKSYDQRALLNSKNLCLDLRPLAPKGLFVPATLKLPSTQEELYTIYIRVWPLYNSTNRSSIEHDKCQESNHLTSPTLSCSFFLIYC